MILENVALAFNSLKSNKMRALLTMLGIIIGIMSIISIVIIGDAMTSSVSDNLSSLGAGNVTVSVQEKGVRAQDPFGGRGAMLIAAASGGKTPESDDLISDQMITGLKASFPAEIEGVSLSHTAGGAQARDGDLYANVSVTGVSADYIKANSVTMLSGTFITDADVNEISQSAVVSDRLTGNLFPDGSDPLGKQIKIYKSNSIELYNIVGVYQYQQLGFGGSTVSDADLSTALYIPVSAAKQHLLEKNYTTMTITASPGSDVESLTAKVQSYFDVLYSHNETWRVNVSNMASMLDTVTSTLGTISTAIAFIAGISLLVGGIGVMNIMLVSVTERTREIGTRKALGAKNFHIRFQFVTEAIIISSVGGLLGLLLGICVGAAISTLFSVPLVLSAASIAGSVFFSMAIGVFFGLYPANKAAKLDPIDALRYE